MHSGDYSYRLPHGGELGQKIHVLISVAWGPAVFVKEHSSCIRENFADWAVVSAFSFAVATLALAQWKHAYVGEARRNSVERAGVRLQWWLTFLLACAYRLGRCLSRMIFV